MRTIKRNATKIRLALVISSNLREWAGMEHVIYELWINRPDYVEITIFQPDFIKNSRISADDLTNLFEGADLISFRGYFNKFSFFENSVSGKLLAEFIFIPVLALVLKYTFLKKLRTRLAEFDVIYFFNSNREPKLLGSGKQILIGSTHAWFPGNSNLFKKIELKLVINKLIMHNLTYFHFFPSQFSLLKEEERKRFFSLPVGVETRKFVPLNRMENSIIKFLFYARLEECKGILTVLEAFKTLKNSDDIELHIVGSGTLLSRIESERDKRILVHGFVSESSLPKLISLCDIFVYPSECDSSPAVVLNALSSGLHVITTPEISKNFLPMLEAGFITTARSQMDDTANSMLWAMENIENIRANKIKCHNMVAEKYDWEQISKEFYLIIKGLYTVNSL